MRRFNISVNGNSYDVAVEEVGASVTSAPVAASCSCSCSSSGCCAKRTGNKTCCKTGSLPQLARRLFLRCPVRL